MMSWFSIKVLLFSLRRLNLNLDLDMDTTLRVVIGMNLMEQFWLMINEKEMVLCVSTEIGLDVVSYQFSLDRLVVIIISLEN